MWETETRVIRHKSLILFLKKRKKKWGFESSGRVTGLFFLTRYLTRILDGLIGFYLIDPIIQPKPIFLPRVAWVDPYPCTPLFYGHKINYVDSKKFLPNIPLSVLYFPIFSVCLILSRQEDHISKSHFKFYFYFIVAFQY